MTATLNLTLALAVLAAAPAAPAAPVKAEESYFLISFRGRTIGKAVRVLLRRGKPGQPLLFLTVSEDYRFSTGDRPAARSSLRRTATMRPDWSPMAIEESSTAGGRTRKSSVEIHPGKAVFTLAGGRKREVPYKGLVLAELSGRALAARGLLAVGKKLTAAVPDLAQGGLVLLGAQVIGARKVEGRKGKLLLVEVRNADGKMAWDLLVDERGRLVEQSTGGTLRKRVRKDLAVLPDRPEALSAGVIHLENAPRRFWRLDKLVVELVLPEVTKGLVPEIAGQRVVESGRRITVQLGARRPDGRLPREKLSEAELQDWLAPEAEPDWRDPRIRKLAAAVTKGTKSDLGKGYMVGRWVHRNLVKSLGGPPDASARQALASRSGDCSEHAALFAALCRAAGVPARTAYGLAGSRGALRFHVWSEYHAGGRWVPLDTAVGRYGLPACYLTLSYDRTEGGARLFKLYAAARGRAVRAEEKPRRVIGGQ